MARSRTTIDWQSHGLTHQGRVRPYNEDAYLARPGIGLWAVADGMGGHEAGDVASRMVVEALETVQAQSSLSDLINTCREQLMLVNAQLYDQGLRQQAKIIGSTAVVMLCSGSKGAIVWAGDSRAYRLRGQQLEQLSEDHSRVMELVKQGQISAEEAESHPQANVITRAIGVAEQLELDVTLFDVAEQDQFLLCSDGLSRYVGDNDLATMLALADPVIAADAMLKAALDSPARDNITAIVARATSADTTSMTELNPRTPGPAADPDDDPTLLDDGH